MREPKSKPNATSRHRHTRLCPTDCSAPKPAMVTCAMKECTIQSKTQRIPITAGNVLNVRTGDSNREADSLLTSFLLFVICAYSPTRCRQTGNLQSAMRIGIDCGKDTKGRAEHRRVPAAN